MTETTHHTPANVRERVAFEAFAWEHGRRGADAEWIRAQWQGETPKWRAMYFDLADRILAIVRTPRGEGEAEAMSANLARALAAMQAAWIEWRRGRGADAAMQWIENTLIGPGLIPGDDASDAQAFFDRAITEIENHQIRHTAALRSEAQGEVWREVDDLLARLERFEHDAAGESEEYWRVVAMRDRIAAARRSEGGGDDV